MHDQPGGLVDDQQRAVLVHHVERHVFRRESLGLRRGLRLYFDAVAHLHGIARAAHFAVDTHGAAFNPLLQPAARKFTEAPCEQLVQALAMCGAVDFKRKGHQKVRHGYCLGCCLHLVRKVVGFLNVRKGRLAAHLFWWQSPEAGFCLGAWAIMLDAIFLHSG